MHTPEHFPYLLPVFRLNSPLLSLDNVRRPFAAPRRCARGSWVIGSYLFCVPSTAGSAPVLFPSIYVCFPSSLLSESANRARGVCEHLLSAHATCPYMLSSPELILDASVLPLLLRQLEYNRYLEWALIMMACFRRRRISLM